MTQANLVEGKSLDKTKALYAAFGESTAELFALAEQVDLAEKAFHEALARRNKAHIAYLREPNILDPRGVRSCKDS